MIQFHDIVSGNLKGRKEGKEGDRKKGGKEVREGGRDFFKAWTRS